MARQGISTGLSANDGLGDNLRAAGGKINDNFSEIYSYFGDGDDLTTVIGTGIATAGGSVGTGVTILDFRGSAVGEVVVESGIATITVSDFQQTYTDADVNAHLNIPSAGTNEVLGWNGTDYTWVSQTSGYGDSNVDVHLNQSNPTAGYVLSWNGSDYEWISNAGYTDASVDAHLNQSNPTAGYVLSWNGSDYEWAVGVTTENVVTDSLSVSGISTLGITSAADLTSQQLNVSGISTLGITSATDLTSQQLNVSGISTFAIGYYGSGSEVRFVSEEPPTSGNYAGNGGLSISHAAGNPYGIYMRFHSHDGDEASIETNSDATMTLKSDTSVVISANNTSGFYYGGTSAELRYSNSTKLKTSDNGVVVNGSVSSSYIGSTETFTVTTGSKTSAHRYNGTGSGTGYLIDGVEAPFLTLTPGKTYRFTNDNTGSHPLRFYLEADKTTEYTSGVNFQNTYTEITVSDETPTVLHYQCSAHGYMGNAVQVNSNKVDTPYQIDGLSGANITGVVTATSFSGTSASFSGNVSIGGTLTYEDVTNIDSVGLVTARSGIHFGLAGVGGSVTSAGNVTFVGVATAASFVKSGGTSAQYLMADGSTTEGDSLTKGYIAGLTAFLN